METSIGNRKCEYDVDKIAVAVNTKRQITNRLTMREAAKQIGVSVRLVHKAETRKVLSAESFTKICRWLGKEPGAYFKTEPE